MSDLIDRQAAIDAVDLITWYHQNRNGKMVEGANSQEDQAWYKAEDVYKVLNDLPSAQQGFDTDQKINKAYDDGYDQGYLQCKTDQDGTMEQEKRMGEWMIFAERLSEQMKKQNLSIRQLAERMDMTTTTIYRYANGQRVPRAHEILKASDALGVTCDYLLGLSDDPKKTSRSSAEPERKKGRWIPHKSIFGGPDEKVYECNQCGYNIGFHTENFCPNCGTDMREDQDGRDS